MIQHIVPFAELPEFDDHKTVTAFHDRRAGIEGYIAIHRRHNLTPAFGATRWVAYPTNEDALRDALRLSRLMSYKSALAGLPYGGAKATIRSLKKNVRRYDALRAYAHRLNCLYGSVITGTDVGLSMDDLRKLDRTTHYVVGLESRPEYYTALGIFYAMQASAEDVFSDEDLTDRTILIQGLGKVGRALLGIVYKKCHEVIIADINRRVLKTVTRRYPRVRVVDVARVSKTPCDIYAPCAMQHALSEKIIPQLQCAIVAGAANNQLESDRAGQLLHRRGILYAPDYAANAGGLMSVTDEYSHKNHKAERVALRVKRIKQTLKRIFLRSRRTRIAPHRIADAMAEKIIAKRT
jgi:leucine dehydrogenase